MDINVVDKGRETPLHWAASGSKLEVARVLIDQGASVNIVDKDGNTPLDLTVSAGFVSRARDMQAFLIQRGAKTGEEIRKGK